MCVVCYIARYSRFHGQHHVDCNICREEVVKRSSENVYLIKSFLSYCPARLCNCNRKISPVVSILRQNMNACYNGCSICWKHGKCINFLYWIQYFFKICSCCQIAFSPHVRFLWVSFCDTHFLELPYHLEHNWGKQTLLSIHLFFNILWTFCIMRYAPNTQPVMWNVSQVDKGMTLPCSRAPLLKTDASGLQWC